jgi:reticulocyte-binding protein
MSEEVKKGYCMKCRDVQEIIDSEKVECSNGRTRLSGKCKECKNKGEDKKISTFVQKERTKEEYEEYMLKKQEKEKLKKELELKRQEKQKEKEEKKKQKEESKKRKSAESEGVGGVKRPYKKKVKKEQEEAVVVEEEVVVKEVEAVDSNALKDLTQASVTVANVDEKTKKRRRTIKKN